MESSNSSNSNTSNTSITPEEVLAQLRALRSQIPDYTQDPGQPAGSLARVAKVDPFFVDAATAAIGVSEPLQQALATTPQQCIEEANDANRWAQVEEEVAALHLGIRNANLLRRHRIAVRSLRAYQMSKQFVRVDGNDDLRPHLNDMRKLNRFGKSRRKPVPSPVPVPSPQQRDEMHAG
jgi:hypothetical protein